MPPTTNQPNSPHHEGKQSVKLELPIGEKRMEIKPSELSIVWGEDKRYWNVQDEGAAELYQVSWLEVTGCVSKTDPGKEYEVGFHISLTPDAFGWTASPVYILVKRGKSSRFKGEKFMLEVEDSSKHDIKANVIPPAAAAAALDDDDHENSDIYFGLYEVWRGKWKGGLKIHHAFIQEK